MTNNALPKLQFFPGSSRGFTPSGISGFSDLRPSAIVRELVQNSLDAAIEAGVKPAKIRFRLTRFKKDGIPGIQEYEDTFDCAVETHKSVGGKLSSQASRVVEVIRKALGQSEQDVLSVLDNGIGLDDSRMRALLGDGISVKGRDAMGTYGNGHSTIIPASNLRYVLYGGVNFKGARIGSGHAVLASSIRDGYQQPRSGDGFLVHKMENGHHICATDRHLPPLITKDVDWITQNHMHGTAIIVPAFNYFKEPPEKLSDLVFESAARNFFPAIQEGRLIVEFEDLRFEQNAGDLLILDRVKLKEVLEEGRENKRKKPGAFISGSRAYSAYMTFQKGEKHTIPTEHGDVEVRYGSTASGVTQVDLYRNGMWITDANNLPRLRYAFSDRQPFHAVLLLNSKSGGKLHELVRNAEGPLHNELHPKQRLSKDKAQELGNAFGKIKEWLKARAPEISSESYNPDDFLALDFGREGETGPNYPSFWGIPEAISKRVPSKSYAELDVGPGPSRQKGTKKSSKSTKSRPQPQLGPVFTATSVAIDTNCQRVVVECHSSLSDAQLRLCVDQNIDATCDLRSRNDTKALILREIRIDDKPVDKRKLIKENEQITGVHLGNIESGDSLDIVLEYSLPHNLILPPDHEPTLRVDIYKG